MNTLVEVAEFIEYVMRLDLDTPVRGFDGTNIGESNEQAQALANRTLWLKKRGDTLLERIKKLEDKEFVASVNKKTGTVTLTYSDVGAARAEHKHPTSDIETTDAAGFVSSTERSNWNDKQDRLVSGETLKTLLNMSLLGEGNIIIQSKDITVDNDNQFVTAEQKTAWTAKQNKLVSGEGIKTLSGQSLIGSGDVTLDHTDVGAEKAGASKAAVVDHVAEEDPHSQYLNKSRGSEYFLDKTIGNKPNGFLQLDDEGHIPSEIAELFKSRYIVADDKADRLSISEGGDITICLQLDENIVYYLSGGEDPSKEESWRRGRSTDVGNVVSVFGRSGVILPESGDYTTDQITETTGRTFVSAEDRAKWEAKQQKLVSGTNLRTVNGETLLGGSNIEITPESIEAAKKVHTHEPDDINTNDDKQFISSDDRTKWDGKQEKLVSGKGIKTLNNTTLLGEGNIEITPKSIGAAAESHKHKPSEIETDDSNMFVSLEEKKAWNAKQAALTSGENIKTLNSESLLGEGNIEITAEGIGAAEKEHKHKPSDIETDSDSMFVSQADKKLWTEKQSALVSGKNIATVFGQPLLSDKDITLKNVEDLTETINGLLSAGDGIDITLDEESGLIKITNTGSSTGGGEAPKPDPINVEEVSDAIAGRSYVFQIEKANYDFIAYALRKVLVSEAETVTFSYEKVPVDLPRTDEPAFDSSGYFPISPEPTTYPLESVTTDHETFSTVGIPSPASSVTRISLDLGGNGKGIVPPMTSAASVGKFTAFASQEQVGYEAWKAFQYDEQLGSLPPKTYWRSPNAFQSEKLLPSIGVICTDPFTIDSFGLQDFTGFANTGENASTYPTSIWLQGRNTSNGGWTTIDTWGNTPIINTGKGWNIFTLAAPATYKEYKLLLRDAANKTRNLAISRLQFYNGIGGLIKSVQGDYYTVDERNELVGVVPSSTMFTDNNFGETKAPIPISDISELFPIKICSNGKTNVKVQYYTLSPQIVLHYPLETTDAWNALNTLMVDETYTSDDKLNMRTAVTVDGSEYFIFKGGKWVSIGNLTNDTASAQTLNEKGMLFLNLSSITAAQWELLFSDVQIDYKLGLAYGSEVETAEDAVTPKTVKASFDEVIQWAMTSKEEVAVYLQGKKIGFKPAQAGDYKFCYKFN